MIPNYILYKCPGSTSDCLPCLF